MSQSPSASSSTGKVGLPRGKACIACRKRKMRCDGARPVCSQCVRANRDADCEYADSQGRTRTQALEETIRRLESRIEELEDPSKHVPSMQLFDPHAEYFAQTGASSTRSSLGDIGQLSVPPSRSGEGLQSLAEESGLVYLASPGSSSAPPLSASPLSTFQEFTRRSSPGDEYWWLKEDTPTSVLKEIFDLFVPLSQKLQLNFNADDFRQSIDVPYPEGAHPALLNAICLWGTYQCGEETAWKQHYPLFLRRTIDSIAKSLDDADTPPDQNLGTAQPSLHPNHVVYTIQAMCLLSSFHLAQFNALGATQYAGAAVSLSLSCGLHRIASVHPVHWPQERAPFLLPSTPNISLLGERVNAFWMVYCLDRYISLCFETPPLLTDGPDVSLQIDTPWPLCAKAYLTLETPHLGSRTVSSFLRFGNEAGAHEPTYSDLAIQAKGFTLLQGAKALVSNWEKFSQEVRTAELRSIESTIARFRVSLQGLDSPYLFDGPDRRVHTTAHSLAIAARIELLQLDTSESRRNEVLEATRVTVNALHMLGVGDWKFLDFVTGISWSIMANFLMNELNRLKTAAQWRQDEIQRADGMLQTLFLSLSHVARFCSISNRNLRHLKQRFSQ